MAGRIQSIVQEARHSGTKVSIGGNACEGPGTVAPAEQNLSPK